MSNIKNIYTQSDYFSYILLSFNHKHQSQRMQKSIEAIYQQFLSNPTFEEVQHIPTQLYEDQTPMKVMETCLVIPYSTFENLYSKCIKILQQQNSQQHHMAADIILCMNGQNEKAWNYKREHFDKLDILRELKLNAAICMKFKKSTVLYDFRLSLIKKLAAQDFHLIMKIQSEFVFNILKRFHRNYYCWTYRLKLFCYLFELAQDKKQFINLERGLVKLYCQSNIHQYSGFWYLFSLLKNRLRNEDLTWADQELAWVTNLIEIFSNLYTKEDDGSRIYSLRKYRQWIIKAKDQKSQLKTDKNTQP